MSVSFYRHYLALVDEIERRYPVSAWSYGDLEIWPLARVDLYLDMYWAAAGVPAPADRSLPLRIAGRVAMPLRNWWRSRHDRAHRVVRPAPAHAMVLGDGLTLDLVDGHWRDRFAEPLIAALASRGLDTFLMQSGHLKRLPWHRPTFAANVIESRGFLRSSLIRRPLDLPGHDDLLQYLARNAVDPHSLGRSQLGRRAKHVVATAASFESVLDIVKPALSFVVGYNHGLGPAFLLACRRRKILTVDLQRAPHGGALHAYRWAALPEHGYATLPAVFWSWSPSDVARVDEWTARLDKPWHRAIHGGHTHLAPFLDDRSPDTRKWDAHFASIDAGARFEREILVALQPIHGHRAVWDALCSQIEASPSSWRWWIRRHPAARPEQDQESARLLALRRPNVLISEATSLPLPALLRHMSAVVSLASGAAVEAAMFGTPAYFLIPDAQHSFAELIEHGTAKIIEVAAVNEQIATVAPVPVRATPDRQPDIGGVLEQLEKYAEDYRRGFGATSGGSGTAR